VKIGKDAKRFREDKRRDAISFEKFFPKRNYLKRKCKKFCGAAGKIKIYSFLRLT